MESAPSPLSSGCLREMRPPSTNNSNCCFSSLSSAFSAVVSLLLFFFSDYRSDFKVLYSLETVASFLCNSAMTPGRAPSSSITLGWIDCTHKVLLAAHKVSLGKLLVMPDVYMKRSKMSLQLATLLLPLLRTICSSGTFSILASFSCCEYSFNASRNMVSLVSSAVSALISVANWSMTSLTETVSGALIHIEVSLNPGMLGDTN